MKLYVYASVLAATVLAGTAQAQEASPPAAPTATEATKEAADQKAFAGFKLGAGISVTIDFGGLERINDAEVVNGVVRVKDEDDVRARIMLESHFFFTPKSQVWGVAGGNWGHGPFIAIQPGSDEIIEAAALGWMIGFRQPNSSDSFNIGLGLAVDPNTKTLGDGIERNMPLPAGETVVRYREEAQYGAVLIFSRTF